MLFSSDYLVTKRLLMISAGNKYQNTITLKYLKKVKNYDICDSMFVAAGTVWYCMYRQN